MPFETESARTARIAVVGGGISGLAAAHMLADDAAVVLHEAEPRLGGHARTIVAGRRGDQPVDTGFIVFNHVNYPHLTRLFDALGVPTAPSEMSFGASFGGGRLEYGLHGIGSLFCQPRNAADPRFLGMVRDILKFNARAEGVARDPAMTIRDLVSTLGLGAWFRDHYLVPMSGAIWSTPKEKVLDFPAAALVRFFRNHGLLGIWGQHQWHTVRGGSVEYVSRLARDLERRGVELRVGSAVAAVRRVPGGVELRTAGGDWELYDEVVMACHSDQALALIADPSPEERAALSAIRYQPNEAVLHADPGVMPRNRKAWASWVYTEAPDHPTDRIGISYWMNALQPIPKDDPLFVTLNPTTPIREDLIHDVTSFAHPVYDVAALAAQERLRALNGSRRTWFAGAWMRNGFHEDGFASAVDVVTAMRARDPLELMAAE